MEPLPSCTIGDQETSIVEHITVDIAIESFSLYELKEIQPVLQAALLAGVKRCQARSARGLGAKYWVEDGGTLHNHLRGDRSSRVESNSEEHS